MCERTSVINSFRECANIRYARSYSVRFGQTASQSHYCLWMRCCGVLFLYYSIMRIFYRYTHRLQSGPRKLLRVWINGDWSLCGLQARANGDHLQLEHSVVCSGGWDIEALFAQIHRNNTLFLDIITPLWSVFALVTNAHTIPNDSSTVMLLSLWWRQNLSMAKICNRLHFIFGLLMLSSFSSFASPFDRLLRNRRARLRPFAYLWMCACVWVLPLESSSAVEWKIERDHFISPFEWVCIWESSQHKQFQVITSEWMSPEYAVCHAVVRLRNESDAIWNSKQLDPLRYSALLRCVLQSSAVESADRQIIKHKWPLIRSTDEP